MFNPSSIVAVAVLLNDIAGFVLRIAAIWPGFLLHGVVPSGRRRCVRDMERSRRFPSPMYLYITNSFGFSPTGLDLIQALNSKC